LTWDDFESEPFCTELYDDKNPTANPNLIVDKANQKFTTRCTVPARNGHHVIYGEWGRSESTLQRFHGCVDVAFGANPIRPRMGLSGRKDAEAPVGDVLGRAGRADAETWKIPLRRPE
jgi:predicted carbohydrate-binding protein with CBM5 and CBM33 domain